MGIQGNISLSTVHGILFCTLWVINNVVDVATTIRKHDCVGMEKKLMMVIQFVFQQINSVLETAQGSGLSIGHLFLVGGFAESAIVQEAIRSEFGPKMKVIIPQVLNRFYALLMGRRYPMFTEG